MFTTLLAGAIGQGMAAHRAAKAAKEQRALLRAQKDADTIGYFEALQSASPTSAAAQARMAQLRTQADRANGSARNAAIAGNQTPEQLLAANQRTAETMAGALNQAYLGQEALRQGIRRQHSQAQNAFAAEQRRLKQQEAHNWSNLGNNLSKALVAALVDKR